MSWFSSRTPFFGPLFCPQIVYVTGGEDLTITSTAAASTISNVHFEVIGYTNLVLDVPDLTMTGIFQSVSGAHIRSFLLFLPVTALSTEWLPLLFVRLALFLVVR